ncbi:MAG: hypothetical protein ACRD3P_17670 [Terriglobales bacterium]
MKRSILTTILACLLLGCVQLEGTTIVVIRTPKHFVVAADSLWIGVDPASPTNEKHAFFCKMRRVGHIYFTSSTSEIDALQLITLGREAMKTSVTIAEAAQKLAAKSDQLAKRTAEMGVPQSVINECQGHVCSDALFFGIENGVPTMVHLDFVQEGRTPSTLRFIPHTYTCPGKCKGPWDIFFLGQKQEIVRSDHPKFVNGTPDQEIARKLVELEEKADPEEVGGPIDVLTLDAQGAHWEPVQGGTCSTEESPTKTQKPNKPTPQRGKLQ